MPIEFPPAQVLPANDLSPRTHKTRLIHDVLTPMRDGVMLAMDLIRPVEDGAYPVVLVRTPYNKVGSRTPFLEELAQRGYIVAIQDTRGRDQLRRCLLSLSRRSRRRLRHRRVGQ